MGRLYLGGEARSGTEEGRGILKIAKKKGEYFRPRRVTVLETTVIFMGAASPEG